MMFALSVIGLVAAASDTIFCSLTDKIDHGEHHVQLVSDLMAPGQQRTKCPKGFMGSVVLQCDETRDGAMLMVKEHDCQPVPDSVCDAFNAACFDSSPGGGVAPEPVCEDINSESSCAKIVSKGKCDSASSAAKCLSSCKMCK